MSHELIVGVSGGIAAFKTAVLVSSLVQRGHGVSVVMTRAARKFVGPATFRALTGRPVASDVFDRDRFPLGAHIELAEAADLVCVAPASADVLAKAACGLADDLLSTLTLAVTCPVLLAPAMNTEMWNKPAVQRNVRQLQADGFLFAAPASGWLSCGQVGAGRMAEPGEIQARIVELLADGGRANG